ncbi:hypothetical protein GGR42_000338 [Saonia flava]|uniref:DUF3500 domain-containing protein n=1 Tax=Saonia flava TaxID=523696 RepID=A0A846QLP1_9FLAO|nr:DUF3500 domain-containing protein [Saonia flava]NJB69876.1 hypothetical protein [Saonia flava]
MKHILTIMLFSVVLNTSCAQKKKETSVPDDIATRFLNSLDENQRAKTLLKQDDSVRTDWHFFPSTMFNREGIQLKELKENQKELVHELLQTYLSESGYKKTMGVIELEGILGDLTNDRVYRDTGRYYTTFYGEPNTEKPWSWSFEGHHVSLNFTTDGDKITYVPLFYGANPAVVMEGPRKGHRSLVNEEDLGLQLINLLSAEQQEKAIIQEEGTFNDILSFNKAEISPLKVEGIPATEMDAVQQKLLFTLINEYISSVPDKIAVERGTKMEEEELVDIYFAWAGAKEMGLGKPHYYRIQGKNFLIEFDNSQNNANHIHAVWRDFNGDFGRNLIKEHYHNSDHHH